ncbi:hypothetical protein [Snodgrassella sp. CFCC 13594]|uniref:hypothetical protein n=1 Tax=Snodgrassella sp. CFCC 13594 TaxID=1775559 RepID=UPI000A988BAD|nr:hypothetical protein [Snodgrassella sp. CFCC 13594]
MSVGARVDAALGEVAILAHIVISNACDYFILIKITQSGFSVCGFDVVAGYLLPSLLMD